MDVKESADSDCRKRCCQEFAAKVNYSAVTSHIVSVLVFHANQNPKPKNIRNMEPPCFET